MQTRSVVVLLAIFSCSCALGPDRGYTGPDAYEAERKAQAYDRQQKALADQREAARKAVTAARDALMPCVIGYSLDHRLSTLTASELTEAALSACGSFIEAIRSNAALAVNRQEFGNEMAELATREAKGLALQALAETTTSLKH